MSKKIYMLGFVLLFLTTLVSAEVNLWTETIINYDDDLAGKHTYLQFDDTSANGIGRNKDVDLTVSYIVQTLPLSLYNGTIDWCNLTIAHTKNEYGTEFIAWEGFSAGELLNTTIEYSNVYFGSGNLTTGELEFELRDKDAITINLLCHYTDPSEIFIDNIFGGLYTIYLPAFECDGCTDYTLEELSNEIEKNEELTEEQNEIYVKVQDLIDRNYQLWLIASWLVKIAFLITAIGLVFAGGWFLYQFFRDIERRI